MTTKNDRSYWHSQQAMPQRMLGEGGSGPRMQCHLTSKERRGQGSYNQTLAEDPPHAHRERERGGQARERGRERERERARERERERERERVRERKREEEREK